MFGTLSPFWSLNQLFFRRSPVSLASICAQTAKTHRRYGYESSANTAKIGKQHANEEFHTAAAMVTDHVAHPHPQPLARRAFPLGCVDAFRQQTVGATDPRNTNEVDTYDIGWSFFIF
jgi:hypothetical protein